MTTIAALLVAGLAGQSPSIEDFTQRDFHDISLTARVVKADQRELGKINHDFGNAYRFSSTHVEAKEPFMLRLDAKAEETNVQFILNGTKQLMRIPRVNFRQKRDLTHNPGERQTLLDFGLLTPTLFESLFQAKFVRNDRETGDAVFDVTYRDPEDTSRSRIWVDRSKHMVTKREWYNQPGRQLATFYYLNPEHISGIWVPTKLEVKNVDGVVAGITQYDAIKVNSGIADSQFKVN
ncbi:MAG TPA: outer membrane lipoprotein-sorting protein [Fimbriimonas sp.]|nr:outer membrane lipoprotein-sorting protein [Fimbriimonas sp.]